MRRADTEKCYGDPSGEHSWIDITPNEEGNQGLRRFTCAACEKQTMEKDPESTEVPWKL